MRNSIWMGMLCVVAAAGAMVSCGDSEETSASNTTSASSASSSGGGQGGTSSSSTSSAGGAGGQGQGGAGSGGGGGAGGGSSLFNGCESSTAEDHTADAMVAIDFGGPTLGTNYSPKCIRVKAGTDVTFNGNFSFHPLQGGTVVGMVLTPDPTSPIMPTATGMSATFNLANQGDYGYYCTAHGLTGMMGAIFVVP